jgi:hypothetical protein
MALSIMRVIQGGGGGTTQCHKIVVSAVGSETFCVTARLGF